MCSWFISGNGRCSSVDVAYSISAIYYKELEGEGRYIGERLGSRPGTTCQRQNSFSSFTTTKAVHISVSTRVWCTYQPESPWTRPIEFLPDQISLPDWLALSSRERHQHRLAILTSWISLLVSLRQAQVVKVWLWQCPSSKTKYSPSHFLVRVRRDVPYS